MRKMADNFAAVRRAELLRDGSYDAAVHEPLLSALDWQHFTDDEFALCPPIIAMGGDGAMLDIGFQNLSRLMASGKPIRVVVLDTQVYSNTGGQACTSGFTGQVADMSAYGKVQHGKAEVRKELSLIAIAHRGVYVHQSSQAAPSHLLAGVLKGLHKRRPVLFNIYTPCPVEHGLADDWSQHASRLALESRAFPFLTYDPDAGPTFADCLSLEGNPSPDSAWPVYTLSYLDEGGIEQTLEVPLTIADWAATETRFKQHFTEVQAEQWDDSMTPFHEYLALPGDGRDGRVPFIHAVGKDRRLRRLQVSTEVVRLAEERQEFWSQLRQIAGLEVSPAVHDLVAGALEAEFERKSAQLKAEYDGKLTEFRTSYPARIARQLAEGLLRQTGGAAAVAELLASLPAAARAVNGPAAAAAAPIAVPVPTPAPSPAPAAESPAAAKAAAPTAPVAAEADDALVIEPYIDTERCTTCDECTNLNKRMFAYNANKQAYLKDPKAGSFQQLVTAAERCPVSIIHPGTPLNPKEKDLAKWLKRAERFG
jgi:pyruvate-ferredoxin/flavodoxin oxidoreductase